MVATVGAYVDGNRRGTLPRVKARVKVHDGAHQGCYPAVYALEELRYPVQAPPVPVHVQ